ncbi:MAG: hypothetical protein KGY66_00905 [Candidatus Thermoplasmatota archaeon]|nr:hypothetical protein [Candidatus Thermoplasmatota archaeon]MBS3789460.1 hypothetical protein [Candidatus Thermoplasmatota archaeon]
MNLKLALLLLSEKLKWKNWPTWLKGIFLLWPSLGPAYLFLTRTPSPTGGEAELSTIMTNLEYQNYFIVVFIGFWSINLILLGLTWTIGSLSSDTYRNYLREKAKVRKYNSIKEKNASIRPKRVVKKYPVLVKKGTPKGISREPKTMKKIYPILAKRKPSRSVK